MNMDAMVDRRTPRVLQYGVIQMILFVMGIMLSVGVVKETGAYDELMEYIESKKTEMEEAMENSTIPDTIDVDKINELVLNVRKQQLSNLISNEQNKD